jgi:UTP--glucose-1-phosphate uridylyltransferase
MNTNASPRRVRKAVIPVAGRALTLLPATRSVPKALLPIIDKPLAEFAVDEAAAAGIEQIVFVTARHASAIEDHFAGWRSAGSKKVAFASVRQPEPRGLGHALCCAETLLDGEPFAVLLPDELILDRERGIKACIELYERTGHSVVATEPITLERTTSCAVLATMPGDAGTRVKRAVDRPGPGDAPSLTGLVGRHVLTASIFRALREMAHTGALHLADALQRLLAHEPVYTVDVDGERIDCGTRSGLVQAVLEVASRDPDLVSTVMRWREAKIQRDVPAAIVPPTSARSTASSASPAIASVDELPR